MKVNRPPLPASWYRPSGAWTLAFLVYAVCLFVVPACTNRWIAAHVEAPWLRVALMIPVTIVAGYGLQLMGFVGHEGMHLSLHRNKLVSAILGLFFASAVVSYLEIGFAAQHWSHHRYVNQARDPDIRPVARLDTWWKRVLLSRIVYNAHYAATAMRLALGRPWPFPYRIPFRRETIQRLAILNFVFAALWIAAFVTIAALDPLAGLVSVALPLLAVLFLSGCQTYLDHAGVGEDPYRNAISRTSPLMTAVYFGANYHMEHHLYPGVPCYRLHKVHELLRAGGYLEAERAPIQPSFFRAYKAVASPYEPGRQDMAFDPFEAAVAEEEA